MYFMCRWVDSTYLCSARGPQFYTRLDDESHGNDFYGGGDHKFDGLCHRLDLFGKWLRGRT